MNIKIAVDAMGGDNSPHTVIEGTLKFLNDHADVDLFIFGSKDAKELLHKSSKISNKVHFTLCQDIIDNNTKPIEAIRRFKNSSMTKAIEAVQSKTCHAVVSAGNTGAYMALSKIKLRTIEGVDRPAIPAIFPNLKGTSTTVLDLGANSECTAQNIEQFAIMGSAYSSIRLNLARPTVGILNIGSEDLKGNQIVQEANELLKANKAINFIGFVEGDDIAKGSADVVVTDGFTGNITLKAIEGTAKFITQSFKHALTSSFTAKIGAYLARPALKQLSKQIDPRLYNGAPFLGLQGIAIKSHGSTDALGFYNALTVAYNLAKANYVDKITTQISHKVV